MYSLSTRMPTSADNHGFHSLGYIPGHIHAFWLIYKKMQAEERYGHGGFICELLYITVMQTIFAHSLQRYRKWRIPAPVCKQYPRRSISASALWRHWTLIHEYPA